MDMISPERAIKHVDSILEAVNALNDRLASAYAVGVRYTMAADLIPAARDEAGTVTEWRSQIKPGPFAIALDI